MKAWQSAKGSREDADSQTQAVAGDLLPDEAEPFDPDEEELPDEDPEEVGEDGEAREYATNLGEWLGGVPLSRQTHLLFGLVAPALVAAFHMWRIFAYTVDDAYISFRYARNFARGWGLVYNQGERIEGYTNFLWTALLGGAAWVGLDPVMTAKLLGGAAGLGTIGMVYLLANRLQPLSVVPCLATWLLASTTIFAGYSVFGLETSLFTLLVTLGSWLMLREEDPERVAHDAGELRRLPWSGLVFAAAALTRPEAPLYLGLWMVFLGGRPLFALGSKGNQAHTEEGQPFDPVRDHVVVLFCCIVAGCVALTVKLASHAPAQLIVIAGTLLVALAIVLAVASLPRRMFRTRNLARATLFLGPVVLHVLWRHRYYGTWLPNTLAAKTGNLAQQVAGGADYLSNYLSHEGPVIYFALFGVAAGLVWRSREALALASIVICASFYVLIVGGDWMPFFRFMAPIQPFLFLLLGLGIRAVIEKRTRVANYGLLLMAMVVVGQRSHRLAADTTHIAQQEKRFWDMAAGGVSRWVADRESRRGHDDVVGTIALGDIGRVGYETDYPILDLLGLVDPVISKLEGGYTRKIGPGFGDRFFDARPRYFVLISAENDCHHPSVIGSQVLYRDPRFAPAYQVAGQVRLDAGFSWCIYEHVSHR